MKKAVDSHENGWGIWYINTLMVYEWCNGIWMNLFFFHGHGGYPNRWTVFVHGKSDL